jgi:hypothetical protein
LRLGHLRHLLVVDELEDRRLLGGPQEDQSLGVVLLEGVEQRVAERLAAGRQLGGLGDQEAVAVVRERRGQVGQHAPEVDALGRRLDEEERVDRGLEEGELLGHAVDVEAVADLVEPVGHGRPVPEQLLVLRDAEEQQLGQAEEAS